MSTGAIRQSAVYETSQSLTGLPESLRMRSLEWGVLFSVTGRHTVAQIGELLGISAAARDAAFGRLLDRGLLKERELTVSEYLRAAATGDDSEPKSLQEYLRSGATWQREALNATAVVLPEAVVPSGAVSSEAVSSEAVSSEATATLVDSGSKADDHRGVDPEGSDPMGAEDPDFDPTVTRAVPTMSREEIMAFKPLTSPSPQAGKRKEQLAMAGRSMEPSLPVNRGNERGRRMDDQSRLVPIQSSEPPSAVARKTASNQAKTLSLRALMSYIMDRAPDLSSGQLDIYRVFIRVDTDLLKRNGITTLRFKEDRRVQDPELQSAISASLKSTLGLSFPEEAYL